MPYAGVLDDVRAICELKRPSRLPVFMLSQEFDVRVKSDADYETTSTNIDRLVATHIAAVREYDYDWVWLHVNDVIEFEVLGVGTKGGGDIVRATCDYLPADRDALRSLKLWDPQKDGRMPMYLEALRRLRAEFGDTALVVGRVACPFTSVTLTFGMSEIMMCIVSDPDFIHEANEFFVEAQTVLAGAMLEAGAHAIWLGDCNASGHLISLDHFKQFAAESCRKLNDAVHDAGGITFLHNSEEQEGHLAATAELGIDIVNCGPGIDINKHKALTTGKCACSGNLDPILMLLNGTPDEVATETRRILEAAMPGGGYAFCSGEAVSRDTPEENMRAAIRVIRERGVY